MRNPPQNIMGSSRLRRALLRSPDIFIIFWYSYHKHLHHCHKSKRAINLHLLKGLCSCTELGSGGGEVEKEEKKGREEDMLCWATASSLEQGEPGIKPPHDGRPTYHTLKTKEHSRAAFFANNLLGKREVRWERRKYEVDPITLDCVRWFSITMQSIIKQQGPVL